MKRMVSTAAAAFLAAVLAVGVVSQAWSEESALARVEKSKTLKVGWAVWHPYVFRDPKNNELEGISYELVQDLGKAMGVKVEWVEDNWSTLPAGIQAAKFEISNLMAITPPRAQAVDFSHSVTKHGVSLIASKDKVDKMHTWEEWDRPGVKIAVTLGANSDMFVSERFKKAEIVRLKTVPENVLALVSGRVDAHASTIDALVTIQREHPELVIVPGSFGNSEVAFALPKGDTALAKEVNKFVDDAKRSGRIQQLLTKYGLNASFQAD